MQEIYPGDTRTALEVFRIYEAEEEYFDISDPAHVVRDSISLTNSSSINTKEAGLKKFLENLSFCIFFPTL